mmetsp:Transcript_39890/g.81678  ORF Transcript_39890/g.81678 Transcript_39890/m.81678 type:complete len:93 (-) Transcript_39890:10-288(-)
MHARARWPAVRAVRAQACAGLRLLAHRRGQAALDWGEYKVVGSRWLRLLSRRACLVWSASAAGRQSVCLSVGSRWDDVRQDTSVIWLAMCEM